LTRRGSDRHVVIVTRLSAVTLGVIFLCALAVPSSASVGEALTLDELVTRADEIVLARAVAAESRYEDGQIVTEVELERLETVRGRRDEPRLRLVSPGGVVGDLGMRVEGAPRVAVGATVMLFARGTARGLRAVGMSQGVFPVRMREGRPWVYPSGEGIVLYRTDARGRLSRARPPIHEPMELDTFLATVRAQASRR
jgi:hypothetical protein